MSPKSESGAKAASSSTLTGHDAFGLSEVAKAFDPDKKDKATLAAGAGGLALGTGANSVADAANKSKRAFYTARINAKQNKIKEMKSWRNEYVAPRGDGPARTPPPKVDPKVKAKRKAKFKKLSGEISSLGAKRAKPMIGRRGVEGMIVGGLAGGTALTWKGARDSVGKAFTKQDVDTAAAGTVAGAGAYQGVSYGTKGIDRRINRKINQDDDLRARYNAHKKAYGDPKGAGAKEWKDVFRNYPKDLPGAKFKRATGHAFSGKRGVALTATTGLATGAAAVKARREVEKSFIWNGGQLKAYKASKLKPKGRQMLRDSINEERAWNSRLKGVPLEQRGKSARGQKIFSPQDMMGNTWPEKRGQLKTGYDKRSFAGIRGEGTEVLGYSIPDGKGGGILRLGPGATKSPEIKRSTYNHERNHIDPKRNPHRFMERVKTQGNSIREGAEEGRADYLAGQSHYPDGGDAKFRQGYEYVQGRMKAAGTKRKDQWAEAQRKRRVQKSWEVRAVPTTRKERMAERARNTVGGALSSGAGTAAVNYALSPKASGKTHALAGAAGGAVGGAFGAMRPTHKRKYVIQESVAKMSPDPSAVHVKGNLKPCKPKKRSPKFLVMGQ